MNSSQKKSALVTGMFGMDARNIIKILLENNCEVVGTYRYSSSAAGLLEKYEFKGSPLFSSVCCDLTDYSGIQRLVSEGQFDLIFNLAAQSHVGQSFLNPYYTVQVDGIGVLNLLESIRLSSPHSRLYSAQTSEQFGHNKEKLRGGIFEQNDKTPFSPNSPYGAAKLLAHNLIRIYRDGYGLFCVGGILFNHTDITRTPTFFERKVSTYVAGLASWAKSNYVDFHDSSSFRLSPQSIRSTFSGADFSKLALGTYEGVYRDIGWSYDYMGAALLMLEADSPSDYIVATGEAYPLSDILKIMFGVIGIADFSPFVYVDPKLVRPVDVPYLRGNPSRIKKELGWAPTKDFNSLMNMLVTYDLQNYTG